MVLYYLRVSGVARHILILEVIPRVVRADIAFVIVQLRAHDAVEVAMQQGAVEAELRVRNGGNRDSGSFVSERERAAPLGKQHSSRARSAKTWCPTHSV